MVYPLLCFYHLLLPGGAIEIYAPQTNFFEGRKRGVVPPEGGKLAAGAAGGPALLGYLVGSIPGPGARPASGPGLKDRQSGRADPAHWQARDDTGFPDGINRGRHEQAQWQGSLSG